MSVRFTWAICLLLILGPVTAFAKEPDTDAIAKVVSDSVAAYQKAFASNDAKAIGALFTPEAEYVDEDGVVFHGREAIEAEFAAQMAGRPKGETSIEITSIRPIAATAIIEEGVSTFTPENDGAISHSRYVATHLRQPDGAWLIASIRELDAPPPVPHERLKALAWLLGRWRQESGGSLVDTEWKWTDNGNYLISEFSVKEADGESMNGTHRIGWDAERGQFRSWIFGADGGSADGWWTPTDDSWSVQLNGVDTTGGRMSAVVRYERDGNDALVISQEQRTAGGAPLPSFSNRVVRQPPSPATRITTR
ncbi:SnoaL-like domain protein [Caulifigura coniformis]|uniref:SnoaL-like domain protein n=1 Tax=Caulifigura coniformis TaxID=2527983 RepID=A0A517S9C4_9PLAN|nr:SgcJ/EcaC family oxidoreductase [Caulifigura coniformis]QDT52737.1 SnoaL-like domain protein [Caulifigura coniformis]